MSVLAHDVDQRQRGLNLRSLLFVPADRPERFAKAASSGADALILDLEDFVAPAKKEMGRTAINDLTDTNLTAVLPGHPDGIALPKAEGAPSVTALIDKIGDAPALAILPIASETPAAVFQLSSYGAVRQHFVGLTWGAENLPAAIGAVGSRHSNGSYRSLRDGEGYVSFCRACCRDSRDRGRLSHGQG